MPRLRASAIDDDDAIEEAICIEEDTPEYLPNTGALGRVHYQRGNARQMELVSLALTTAA